MTTTAGGLAKTYLGPNESNPVKQNSVIRQILETVASGSNLSNPSGLVGLAAINGSAATGMRSDGAPALDQSISPTWTGNHYFKSGFPWIDVRAYGAKGDFPGDFSSLSDDTAAINNAITAAVAISDNLLRSGAIVFIPSGTYRVSGPINVPGDVQIIGAGRVSTVIINSSTTDDVFQVTGSSSTIADLTIYGCGVSTVTGASVPTSGWAIDVTTAANNCKFANLTIGRTFHGINTGSSGSNGLIEFCYIFDIYGQYMINGAPGWTIEKNQLDMTFYGGVYGDTAQFQAWATNTPVSHGDVQFANSGYFFCTAGGTTSTGGSGPAPALFNTTITDGPTVTWTFLCATNLKKINLGSGSATIRGNDLSGPSRFGIIVSSGSNIIESNNFAQTIGIALQITGNAVGNIVKGNQFTQTFASSTDVSASGLGNHINAVMSGGIINDNFFNESSGVSVSIANSDSFNCNDNVFNPPYGTPTGECAIQLVSCHKFNCNDNAIPASAVTSTGSINCITPTAGNFNIIANIVNGVAVVNSSGLGNVQYNI